MADIQIDSENTTPPPLPQPEEAGFGAKVIGKTALTQQGPASYRHLTWAAIVSILSAMVFAAVITLQFLEQKDMKAEPSVWHPTLAE